MSDDIDVAVTWGFVDLGGKRGPTAGAKYQVISVDDPVLAGLPLPGPHADGSYYMVDVSIVGLWISHLHRHLIPGERDVLLKLSGTTRPASKPAESGLKVSPAVTVSARAHQHHAAPAGFRAGLAGLLVQNDLRLGVTLVEKEKGAVDQFNKFKAALGSDAETSIVNALKPIPYLELAGQVADGILKAFGGDHEDTLWDQLPQLSVHPQVGMPYLREGIYVMYDNSKEDLPLDRMRFGDHRLVQGESEEHIDRNYLVLSIGLASKTETELTSLAQKVA